jgi:hypothetical protein
MELHLGKMTWRELSRWFGLNEDTLNKGKGRREKKLEILKHYADYHLEGRSNKLYIDRIYIPEFSKTHEIVEAEFSKEWNSSGIDTCVRVGKAIHQKHPELAARITEETAINYTCKVKVERYGRNHLDEDYGTRGRSEYVWMDQDGKTPLPKEKLQVMRKCAKMVYRGKGLKAAAIDDDYRRGRIKQEERDVAIGESEPKALPTFVYLVKKKLGFMPIKKTLLVDEEGCA